MTPNVNPAAAPAPRKKFNIVLLFAILAGVAILSIGAFTVFNLINTSRKLAECKSIVTELNNKKDKYSMADSFSEYASLLEECNAAIQSKDLKKAKALLEDAEDFHDILINENKAYVDSMIEKYQNIDMTLADANEKSAFADGIKKIEELSSKEEFASLKDAFAEMDSIVLPYIEPENPLTVAVQQVDVSAYPNVKLYARFADAASDKVPENLEQTLFFIKKKDANANYVKQTISKVSQLNESDSLNINMVADVSGSMSGAPLNSAKSIMSNFINSVQFSAGDKVELTSFSTGVYIEREFCDTADTLISDINNLKTGDMTSLYDALYTSVTRVAKQAGAKCVIAFTDGEDNYSSCTSDTVIETAKRYHIPIFLIGIGGVDEYSMNNIATQTGGAFYNIQDIASMEDIYSDIYKHQKELYLIEYVDDESGKATDPIDIILGYNSQTYGGNDSFSYTPNVLLSVEGDAFYQDGPEAVVEAYMKAFDDAMTHSDFSYISNYLKPGSNIYKTQEKYVTKDFEELLDSYEIVDVTYNNSSECIVTTRETYFVQASGKPLQLLTQQCQYIVVADGNSWKMTDFASSVKVLSRIKQ